MATIFVYLESAGDVPLTGASPTLTYWDKATPGGTAATGLPMTELVGGSGGGYFADVTTADGKEYFGIVDSTVGAAAGTRYKAISFSGTTEARIETDIPLIITTGSTGPWTTGITAAQLTMLRELWQIHGLDSTKPLEVDAASPTGSRQVPIDGSTIDQTVATLGTVTTVTRT